MAVGEHAIVSGAYTTQSITSNTNVRDVSSMLDLWAHKWTPVLNRLDWADESGGLVIEWVTEHLGFGYVVNSATVTSAGTSFVIASGTGGLSKANQMKQLQEGTMLYANKDDGSATFYVCTSVPATGTVTFSCLLHTSSTITADSKIYIIGHFVNEGSDPFSDVSRARTLLSNKFAILRKDIKISGSQANTDMYAVGNEPDHQMTMRLLEMQREREWSVLYSTGQGRSATVASYIYGAFGFLNSVSTNDWVDTTSTSITESAINTMAARLWDNGATGPLALIGHSNQVRKFTTWDQNRVRTTPDARMGGHYITSYLTDSNIMLDLIPLRKAPVNLLFMLDLPSIKLRAKKNRKLIAEKLARTGDYDRWQILSEYTLEMRGYEKGMHAMWDALT